jgi:hypothetical protein
MDNMKRVSRVLLNSVKRNVVTRYKDEGIKHAWQKTVQSAAIGGVIDASIGALQGEDPWQAAKAGIFQGAALGIGHQSLRFATNANRKTFKGNMKHIASTGYKGMSRQLKTVLQQKKMAQMTKGTFGLK